MSDPVVTGVPRVPRPVVPTDRQRELDPSGTAVANSGVGPAPLASRRPRAARRWRLALADGVRSLDPRTIGGPRLPLVLLGLAALLNHWDDIALHLLLPDMRAEFGVSLQFLLTLTSVVGVIAVLFGPLLGYLADRVKRVWMLRVGGMAAAAGAVVQGLAPGIPQLVIGRAVAGAGTAVREPAGFPLVTDYYPTSSRARVFAFLGFMGGLGAVVGPAVAGNLDAWFGWRVAVVSLGALASTVTLGMFLLREPIRGYHDRRELGASETVARREQSPVTWTEGWHAAASVGTLRWLWYATPFLQVARTGMTLFISLYFAEEFGLGPQQRGYIATLHGVVALAGVLVAAPVADRLLAYRPGRVMVALGGLMFLYAGSVVILAFSHNLALSVVVGLPLGFGFVAIGPALNTLTSLVVPARLRGQGLQTLAPWQLVGLLLLPFIGMAADSWGLRRGLLTFVPVYLIGAVILTCSAAAVTQDMRAAHAAALADAAVERARAEGSAKLLVCRDVDVHHGGARSLAHVDLDVRDGEIVAIIGPNGAGKSTLLRAIAGLQPVSNGAVFYDGRDVTHMPAHQRAKRGMTLTSGGRVVPISLSVRENVQLAAWARAQGRAGAARRAHQVLAGTLDLSDRAWALAGTLSGGEREMVAVAQALAGSPRLWLVDEFGLGLAPSATEWLLDAVKGLQASGASVIVASQSLEPLRGLAPRVIVMERGEMAFDGSVEELSRQPELLQPLFSPSRAAGHNRGAVRGASLRVENVSVRAAGADVLHDVSISVSPGELVGLVGPNGAGKTTLLDVISGFVRPSSGRITLAGRPLDDVGPAARARLGLVRSLQDPRLFPSLTVREHLAVALGRTAASPVANPLASGVRAPAAGRYESDVTARVTAQLRRWRLERVADAFVGELSTGTRRAVELASAALAGPSVLLLDEPSSALARAETREVARSLRQVADDTGAALLVVEHDLPLIASIADRLVAIAGGRVVAEGPPDRVLEHVAVRG